MFYLLGIDWWIRQVHALRLGRQMVDQEANTQAHTERERYTVKIKHKGFGASDWGWG